MSVRRLPGGVDETYHKDLWVLFGAAAPMTRRLRFGPEVTHVILRDPTLIAQQAATLDELTGGRAEIVFSIGNLAMLDQYEVAWQNSRPLARLREAHQVMRRFLTDGAHRLPGRVLPVLGPVHRRQAGTATNAAQARGDEGPRLVPTRR